MEKFPPPDPFNFARPSNWPDWKQRFSRYRTVSKLAKEAEEFQVSALIYTMGPEAEHVFKSFVYAGTESADKYEDVMNKFDGHFVPKRNVIFERAKFHSKVQTAGESVEAFIRQLYELADNCDFGALKDEQIRDRLVIGICDKQLSQKLQMQSDLTLRDATEMARHSELVKTQNAEGAAAAERVESGERHSRTKKTAGATSTTRNQAQASAGSTVTETGASDAGAATPQQRDVQQEVKTA